MNSLKIKLQKCKNVKEKLNNMGNFNEFNFSNEEVEEKLRAGGVKAWLMQEVPVTRCQNLRILFMRHKQIIYSVFLSNKMMCH